MGSTSKLGRWLCSSVVRAIFISLLFLLSFPAQSTIAARTPTLLLIRVRDDGERVLLADLKLAATRAGMDCKPKPTTTYDGRPEPNPGIDCFLPERDGNFRGNLSAVGLLAKKVVFLFILSSNVSNPHGEVDPVIEQVLLDFKQGF